MRSRWFWAQPGPTCLPPWPRAGAAPGRRARSGSSPWACPPTCTWTPSTPDLLQLRVRSQPMAHSPHGWPTFWISGRGIACDLDSRQAVCSTFIWGDWRHLEHQHCRASQCELRRAWGSSVFSKRVQRCDAHTDSRTSSTVALSDVSSTVQPFHVYTCSQVSLHRVSQCSACQSTCLYITVQISEGARVSATVGRHCNCAHSTRSAVPARFLSGSAPQSKTCHSGREQ